MSDSEEYNGWKNRETWAFWLHVTNDQGWYESVREYATDRLMGDPADYVIDDLDLGEGVVEYVKETLDELLESYVETRSSYAISQRGITNGVRDLTAMRDGIGSWWRIDHAEIGAAARDLVDGES